MDQKQYVLIFSTAYLPFIGGAELAIKEITDRLQDLHFILITARMRRDLPRRERVGSIDVYRVGVGIPFFDKMFSPILAACLVFTITRRIRVRLFWSVMVSYTTITPVLLNMFGFYRNVPFLLTLQEGDSKKHIFEGRFGFIAYWWRACLKYANHVQVISTYLVKLAKEFGYEGRISLVPNGVDTEKFKIIPISPRTLGKAGVIQHAKIITVSRLVEKNGVDVLMRAFAKVHKEFPFAELCVVGDGPLRRKLEELSHDLGIANSVKFNGAVAYEKIPQYLAKADVFVRPSRSEGLGTAFLEAMAMGLPVVGTRVGGIPDFLEHERTGLFTNVDDAEDLAKQIMRLCADGALYEKLSRNGKELVQKTYTWDAITRTMKDIMIHL